MHSYVQTPAHAHACAHGVRFRFTWGDLQPDRPVYLQVVSMTSWLSLTRGGHVTLARCSEWVCMCDKVICQWTVHASHLVSVAARAAVLSGCACVTQWMCMCDDVICQWNVHASHLVSEAAPAALHAAVVLACKGCTHRLLLVAP